MLPDSPEGIASQQSFRQVEPQPPSDGGRPQALDPCAAHFDAAGETSATKAAQQDDGGHGAIYKDETNARKKHEKRTSPDAEARRFKHRLERYDIYHAERYHGLGWTGCTMTCLLAGRTTSQADVTQLAQMINAIHAWGEGRHATAVVEDVLALHSAVN